MKQELIFSLSIVDHLSDLNSRHHPAHRTGSSRCAKRKQNTHPYIVASFNVQSEGGNYLTCNRCEISTYVIANDIGHLSSLKHGLEIVVAWSSLVNLNQVDFTEIVPRSVAISKRRSLHYIQMNLRLYHYIQNEEFL